MLGKNAWWGMSGACLSNGEGLPLWLGMGVKVTRQGEDFVQGSLLWDNTWDSPQTLEWRFLRKAEAQSIAKDQGLVLRRKKHREHLRPGDAVLTGWRSRTVKGNYKLTMLREASQRHRVLKAVPMCTGCLCLHLESQWGLYNNVI